MTVKVEEEINRRGGCHTYHEFEMINNIDYIHTIHIYIIIREKQAKIYFRAEVHQLQTVLYFKCIPTNLLSLHCSCNHLPIFLTSYLDYRLEHLDVQQQMQDVD